MAKMPTGFGAFGASADPKAKEAAGLRAAEAQDAVSGATVECVVQLHKIDVAATAFDQRVQDYAREKERLDAEIAAQRAAWEQESSDAEREHEEQEENKWSARPRAWSPSAASAASTSMARPSCQSVCRLLPQRAIPQEAGLSSRTWPSRHLPQPTHPPHFHPLHHQKIPLVIEARTMRTHKLTRRKMVARLLPQLPPSLGRAIVAQVLDHLVLAIHQRHSRAQVRDHELAIPLAEVTRQIHAAHKAVVLAIQGEVLQPGVGAVGHQQQRLRSAQIHGDAVRAVQLARLFALAAERADELALAIILVNVARTIAIAHVDIAVGRDGQVGRAVLGRLAVRIQLVEFGLLGIAQRKDFFAIQRRLHYDPALGVAQIQKLRAAFLADVQAVRAALKLLAPGLDALAAMVEYHHRIVALAGIVDRVVYVDVRLRILADAVRIAVFDVGRQFAPIVRAFVFVVAFAQDRLGAAGLVLRAQNDRAVAGQRSGAYAADEAAARCFRHSTLHLE